MDSGITFTVSNPVNGQVRVGGVAVTSFTGTQLSAGQVSFVHNGSETLTASFQVAVEDGNEDGSAPVAQTFNLTVTTVNDAPTLTLMAAPVDTVAEDTQVQVTFAEIAAQGDEFDVDGSVTAFVVKSVTSGTLLIGTTAGTAAAWNAVTNNTIDATNHAFWTGASNASGTLNAFTVVAKDNGGLGSALPAVQVQVNVTTVNDSPLITGTATHTVSEDAASTVATHLLTATDPEGDPISWTVLGGTQPEAVDYSFNIDNFRIYRNPANPAGSLVFQDTFSNGIAPGVADPTLTFADGTTVATYAVSGTFTESAGNAVLDTQSGHAAPISAVGTGGALAGQTATLLSNSTTDTAVGLKKQNSFIIEGLFDLSIPDDLREGYGIRLTDRTGNLPAQLGNDTLELMVRKGANGNIQVTFRDIDFTGGIVTRLDSFEFVPIASETQIVLRLSHAVNSPDIIASFDFIDSVGAVTRTITLTQAGQVFTGEDWTRAGFFANAPSPTDSFLTGDYGTLSIDQAGNWTYGLLNNSLAVQALGATDEVHDTFIVQADDGNGGVADQIIDITVNGQNDAPTLTGDLSITVSNGGTLRTDSRKISSPLIQISGTY